jgi:ABC-2 type transport system ATP-binding protein
MTDAIAISGLRVVRGANLVLDQLYLTIPAGRVTGLLGPSGCGKSTLMRSIVGVQKIAAGEVRIFGEPAGTAPLRHRVAYLTQSPSIYSDLTVEQNLRYFASVLGEPSLEVGRVIEAVGLSGCERSLGARLSGGQRSRLSLASALLGRPELLVLDEPTVGLDPVIRRELWEEFHRLAESGATLLVSSHVMDEAERCDRLILMREGEIIAHDTPYHSRQDGSATVRMHSSRSFTGGGQHERPVSVATAQRVILQLATTRAHWRSCWWCRWCS